MQKLQDIHVHDQRFAAAGGAHKSQLVQFIRRIGLKINESEGLVFDLPQPCIKIRAKCVRVGKIPIQIHLREEQGDILEILPLQSTSLLSDLAGVTADVFIIQAQLFRRDSSASHLADMGDIGIEICVAAFVDALVFAAVQLFTKRTDGINFQLMQKIAEQHELIVERGLRGGSSCHIHVSSNIRFLNSVSVIRTVQPSLLPRRFSRLLSPLTKIMSYLRSSALLR